jgi:hypothetical protein
MPFKSKAQQRWMFATDPKMAKRWADHTSDIKSLPDHVGDDTEKKGFFHMNAIAGLAKQAADDMLVEKLASDTQITPDLVRHLAGKVGLSANQFVKLAYQDPADYTVFLKVISGAVHPNALTAGAQTGALTKLAKDLLSKAVKHMGNAASAAGSGVSKAYKGARGQSAPGSEGGIFGTSTGSNKVTRAIGSVSPIGGSAAGRAATVAGVGGAAAGANEALPGNRFSSKPQGGMANSAMQAAGQAAKPPQTNGAAPNPAPKPPAPAAGGGAGGSGGEGMSTGKKVAIGGGLAAGALGAGALMRKKKKKEVMAMDAQFAKNVMVRVIEKRAADMMRKEAADTLIGYLDFVASHMTTEKTASVRKLQAAVAEGKPLSHAIKLAYPTLNGEQRGILAVDMVEKAAKYQKGKSGFDSGSGGMKVSGSKSGTCKPGEAGSMMKKMSGDAGMTKVAKNLINTIMKNRGAAGLGVGAMGLGAAGAMGGAAAKGIQGKPATPGGQKPMGALNSALAPK